GASAAGLGSELVAFQADRFDEQLPRIRAFLADHNPRDGARLARLPVRLTPAVTALAPEVWVGIGAVLLLLVVFFVLVTGLLPRPGSGDRSEDGFAASPPATTAGPEVERIRIDLSVLQPTEREPASPAVSSDSSRWLDLLPARCVVATPADGALPDVIDCDGGGSLQVTGDRADWHAELGAVRLTSGAVATVVLGAGPGTAAGSRIQIGPGSERSLAPYGTDGGVERVELTFGADGQTVTFVQVPGRAGHEAVLTFRLAPPPSG
ncbi:MAG: hypothetical protein R2761_31155, partial [Acidimicrobiales bacterium]